MPNPAIEYTVRSYFQRIDSDQLVSLGDFAAPNYQLHFAGLPEPLDSQGAVQLIGGIRTAFPDLRHGIEQISGADGRVQVQVAATGTQRGDFQGVPARGRAIAVPSTHAFRFENGQIAEHWIDVGMGEIVRQISVDDEEAAAAQAAALAVAQSNKSLVLRFFEEVINQEQPAVIDEIFAADVVIHDPLSGLATGRPAVHGLLGVFDSAFPHHRVTVDWLVAEGNYVSALHTHYAVHAGSFLGMPPTGKSVVVNGIELFRVAGGQIVEFWRKDDDASLLIQLGMLPAPQPA